MTGRSADPSGKSAGTRRSITKGTRTLVGGRRVKRYKVGRVCANPRCKTVISVYNRSIFCNRHKPFKTARVRGRSTKKNKKKK